MLVYAFDFFTYARMFCDVGDSQPCSADRIEPPHEVHMPRRPPQAERYARRPTFDGYRPADAYKGAHFQAAQRRSDPGTQADRSNAGRDSNPGEVSAEERCVCQLHHQMLT
jgi:hypothetical protein